jgi:hypothetical protein
MRYRSVAWIERSEIRDRRVRADGFPDDAALHPGHEGHNPLRCPTGKTRHPLVDPRDQKYSALPKFGNHVCVAATRPKEEGRIAIVTNAGRAAVGAGSIGAMMFCRAGNRERDSRAYDRCDLAYGKIVWSWRPGSVRQVLR